MKSGVFIVIDGTDGSGKATQTRLLVERMKTEGLPVETISFPQYGKNSCGPVEEYLSGSYGSAGQVGPYRGSVLFAVDRFDASARIEQWLTSGTHVIADRYVGSNMGHQGSKIKNAEERKKFLEWEMDFEHRVMGIPKPDLNLILHVPAEVSLELTKKRTQEEGVRSGGTKDVHESDPEHIRSAERTYLEIAQQFDAFDLIECVHDGKLLSPDSIHQLIWKTLTPLLKEE